MKVYIKRSFIHEKFSRKLDLGFNILIIDEKGTNVVLRKRYRWKYARNTLNLVYASRILRINTASIVIGSILNPDARFRSPYGYIPTKGNYNHQYYQRIKTQRFYCPLDEYQKLIFPERFFNELKHSKKIYIFFEDKRIIEEWENCLKENYYYPTSGKGRRRGQTSLNFCPHRDQLYQIKQIFIKSSTVRLKDEQLPTPKINIYSNKYLVKKAFNVFWK